MVQTPTKLTVFEAQPQHFLTDCTWQRTSELWELPPVLTSMTLVQEFSLPAMV